MANGPPRAGEPPDPAPRGHFLDGLDPDGPFDLVAAGRALRCLESQVLAMSRRDRDGADGAPGLVGLDGLVRRMIQAIVIDEHCLIEGAPGLAKTVAAKTLARMLGLVFRRIQFVPDLMPSDLIQRERLGLDPSGRAVIEWKAGPIFTNLLLADEINRASPKAQAALLEVTEERQVTPLYQAPMLVRPREPLDEAALLERSRPYFGEGSLRPDERRGQAFVLLATMNPMEQEGVYPLSEAQLDRFAFHVRLPHPAHGTLDAIAAHAFETERAPGPGDRGNDPEEHARTLYFLARLRRLVLGPEARRRWLAPGNAELRGRVGDLIDFTHALPLAQASDSGWRDEAIRPEDDGRGAKDGELRRLLKAWEIAAESGDDGARAMGRYASDLIRRLGGRGYPEVQSGSSPRGLLKLIRAAHAEALLNGHVDAEEPDRPAPRWDDFAAVAPDVLRHRVRLTAASEARGMRSDRVIKELLGWVDTRPTTRA